MQKKDYIVRQLEELGKVMAVIYGSKQNAEWEKFEKEIAEAVMRFTSLEINHVESLDESAFSKNILKSPSLSSEQQKILADLLYEKLNYYLTKNETEKYLQLKDKCIRLYELINSDKTQNEFNLDSHYKLEFLKKINKES
jgi:hypothetical protein